jgi:glycosyltransferase involved in cell wall biosynthesis
VTGSPFDNSGETVATIDVLMPVRNGVRFLGASIESITGQTYADWRLLILDHGSSDGSAELANSYAARDARIRVLSMPAAEHLGGLMNAGLEHCDCHYLMRHDADDIALPNRMALMNEFYGANRQYVVVGGEALMIDGRGRQIDRLQPPTRPEAITAASFFYNPIIHPTVTINFPTFRKMGASYGRDFLGVLPDSDSISVNRCAEDYILFGQIGLMGLCANLDVPLIRYRVHAGSESVAKVAEQIRLCRSVAQFLSKSFCRMRDLELFDPEPFSNHSGHISNFGKAELTAEYSKMSRALLKGIGDAPEVKRELAFRWVLAARSPLKLAARYARFELSHKRKSGERAVIRNWARRIVRGTKYRFLDAV